MDSCCNCGRFLPWDAQESGRSHSSTKILLSLRSLSTEVFSWKSDLCTFANVLWPSNIIWLYHLSSSCHGGLHGSFNIMIGWNASLLPHHRCHLWKLARMHQRAKPCLDSIFWRSTLSVIGRQNEPNLTVLLICTPVYTRGGLQFYVMYLNSMLLALCRVLQLHPQASCCQICYLKNRAHTHLFLTWMRRWSTLIGR